jgi:hypothetical protein
VSSSALRISQNSGEEVFYGKKYKVEKVCFMLIINQSLLMRLIDRSFLPGIRRRWASGIWRNVGCMGF